MGADLLYDEQPFEHYFPTPERYGYDGVGKIFNHLFPRVKGWGFDVLHPPADNWENYGLLHKFNQDNFNEPGSQMMKHGYLYFPYTCFGKKCNLHIAMHSCYGGTLENFVYAPGGKHYGRYAATNDLIILYPMA